MRKFAAAGHNVVVTGYVLALLPHFNSHVGGCESLALNPECRQSDRCRRRKVARGPMLRFSHRVGSSLRGPK